jgi:hypothetical protein
MQALKKDYPEAQFEDPDDGRCNIRSGKAKFANCGLILGSSQFSLLPQRPLKMTLAMKVVLNRLKNKHLATLI